MLDASCRVAKKSSGYGEDTETFDPLEVYGLDDDPPRPAESERRTHRVHDNILEWRRGDTNPPTFHRLNGRQVAGFEDMPPRLLHLSNWIAKHLDSPVAAWWALRQKGVHPRLAALVHRELRQRTDLHPEARRIWNFILEYQFNDRNFAWDRGWFDLMDRLKNEGWSPSVLRDFETVTAPMLSLSLPLGVRASKPPFKGWEEIGPEELAQWELEFPDQHGETLKVPDEALEPVFRIIEGHFRRAAGLLAELNTTYFTTPTCYPDRDVDGDDRHRNSDATFLWFLELFARMVSHNPTIVRAYVVIWSADDEFFFRKLKLFALNHIELFEADEAADVLIGLNQECFWDDDVVRELLFLIHDRWEDFSEANKITIAGRLLNGPDKMDHWAENEYSSFRDRITCRYTRWLTLQGHSLSAEQATRLDEMISDLPEWDDGWASSLVKEHGGHFGWVGTDEAPDAIMNLPVNEIVERAKNDLQRDIGSFTEKRPFTGLVKANPRKALASLSYSARYGDYPQAFWTALLDEWPEETTPRLFRVFLNRLGGLPDETIRELRHPAGQWIKKKFLSAFQFDKDLAWKTFDHLVSGLISEAGAATKSGIGETWVGGEVVQRSRRTFGHAINGPIGEAAEGLVHALDSLKLDKDHGIPEEFKTRFERLTSAPGEGGDHAVAILTNQVSWLHYLDPEWVMSWTMPWFSFEHPASEPAWNGYLSAARVPPQGIGSAIKPLLLELFPTIYQWSWDRDLAKIAAQIIVELAVFRKNKPDGLSAKEARHCLRNMHDNNRQDAVFRLGKIGQLEEDGWSVHVIPFINTVWPRERAFRTSTLVSSWVSLLNDTGEDFPAVLSAVHGFLVPVEGESHRLYRFSRDVGGNQPLTVKHPEAVLELLDAIVPNSAEDAPHDLKQILDLLEETNTRLVRDRRFLRLIDLVEQK